MNNKLFVPITLCFLAQCITINFFQGGKTTLGIRFQTVALILFGVTHLAWRIQKRKGYLKKLFWSDPKLYPDWLIALTILVSFSFLTSIAWCFLMPTAPALLIGAITTGLALTLIGTTELKVFNC